MNRVIKKSFIFVMLIAIVLFSSFNSVYATSNEESLSEHALLGIDAINPFINEGDSYIAEKVSNAALQTIIDLSEYNLANSNNEAYYGLKMKIDNNYTANMQVRVDFYEEYPDKNNSSDAFIDISGLSDTVELREFVSYELNYNCVDNKVDTSERYTIPQNARYARISVIARAQSEKLLNLRVNDISFETVIVENKKLQFNNDNDSNTFDTVTVSGEGYNLFADCNDWAISTEIAIVADWTKVSSIIMPNGSVATSDRGYYVTVNGEYEFIVYYIDGTIAGAIVSINNIDKEAPEAKVEFKDNKVEITVVESGSGIEKIYYQWSNSISAPMQYKLAEKFTIPYEYEGEGYLHILVIDKAGNEAVYTSGQLKIILPAKENKILESIKVNTIIQYEEQITSSDNSDSVRKENTLSIINSKNANVIETGNTVEDTNMLAIQYSRLNITDSSFGVIQQRQILFEFALLV